MWELAVVNVLCETFSAVLPLEEDLYVVVVAGEGLGQEEQEEQAAEERRHRCSHIHGNSYIHF